MDTPCRCRMCLTECHVDELQSMLVPCNDSINLWTMYDYIMMNVGEAVDSTNVPHICRKCKERLQSAYLFKVMCAETERTLSELIKNEQTDNKSEIEYVLYDSEDNDALYADICVDDNVEVCEDSWVDGGEDDFTGNHVETVVDLVYDTNDEDVLEDSVIENPTHTLNAQYTGDERTTSNVLSRKCKKCKMQFEDMKAYRLHYRKFHQRAYNRKLHKSNTRSCLACNIQFENVNLYQVHYRRFHQRPVDVKKGEVSARKLKVLCSHCGQLFSKSFIGKHLRTKHSVNEKEDYVCTTCGKCFKYRENLSAHKRIHTNDKRFVCEVCGEKFLHWATRRNHIRSKHTGEKHYECHLCSEKFTYASNLHRHIRRHTNELPHICSFCPKGFATKNEFNNHQIVHTKVKNHVCEKCEKRFGTRKNLLAHMRIHSERNYHCTVCDKRFTQAHVLRTHLKTHPGVEMPERGVVLSQKALRRLENVSKSVEFEK